MSNLDSTKPQSVSDKQKLCSECGKLYPATTEYFYSQKRKSPKSSGLTSQCKSCRKARSRRDWRQKFGEPEPRLVVTSKCLVCEAEFRVKPYKAGRPYCSIDCYYTALREEWSPRRRLPDVHCEWCGKTFRPRRAATRFCSMMCVNGYSKLKGDLETKKCPDCQRTFPATTEYFLKASDRPPRYVSTYCRDCSRAHWLARSKTASQGYGVELAWMYNDQNGLCAYCECELHGSYQVDHMIPKSRGGAHDPLNFALTCSYCNASKGSRTAEEFWEVKCRT